MAEETKRLMVEYRYRITFTDDGPRLMATKNNTIVTLRDWRRRKAGEIKIKSGIE